MSRPQQQQQRHAQDNAPISCDHNAGAGDDTAGDRSAVPSAPDSPSPRQGDCSYATRRNQQAAALTELPSLSAINSARLSVAAVSCTYSRGAENEDANSRTSVSTRSSSALSSTPASLSPSSSTTGPTRAHSVTSLAPHHATASALHACRTGRHASECRALAGLYRPTSTSVGSTEESRARAPIGSTAALLTSFAHDSLFYGDEYRPSQRRHRRPRDIGRHARYSRARPRSKPCAPTEHGEDDADASSTHDSADAGSGDASDSECSSPHSVDVAMPLHRRAHHAPRPVMMIMRGANEPGARPPALTNSRAPSSSVAPSSANDSGGRTSVSSGVQRALVSSSRSLARTLRAATLVFCEPPIITEEGMTYREYFAASLRGCDATQYRDDNDSDDDDGDDSSDDSDGEHRVNDDNHGDSDVVNANPTAGTRENGVGVRGNAPSDIESGKAAAAAAAAAAVAHVSAHGGVSASTLDARIGCATANGNVDEHGQRWRGVAAAGKRTKAMGNDANARTDSADDVVSGGTARAARRVRSGAPADDARHGVDSSCRCCRHRCHYWYACGADSACRAHLPWPLRSRGAMAAQRQRDRANNIFNLLSLRAWLTSLPLASSVGLLASAVLGIAVPAFILLLETVINAWVQFDTHVNQAAARVLIKYSIVRFVIVTLVAATLLLFQQLSLGAMARRLRNRLRLWAFTALLQTNGIDSDRLDRYMYDYDVLGRVIGGCSAAVSEFGFALLSFVQTLASLVVGLVLSARFFIVLIASTPLFAVFGFARRLVLDRELEKLRAAQSDSHHFTEMVRATMPTVTLSNQHQHEFVKLHTLMERERGLQRRVTLLHSTLRVVQLTSMTVVFFCIGVFWGSHLADADDSSTGQLVTVGMLAFVTIFSMVRLAQNASAFARADQRLQSFLDFVLEIVDQSQSNVNSSLSVDPHDVSVTFHNVSYCGVAAERSSGARLVLVNLNMRVGHMQKHAIVALRAWTEQRVLELLVGAIAPDAGELLLGKHALSEYSRATLAATVGIVPARGRKILLGATVYENITYGSSGASFAEVRQAAMLVGMHELIVQMPRGYQTVVHHDARGGDSGSDSASSSGALGGGVRLTDAQVQVVALARALLKKPQLLIIDTVTYMALMETTVAGSALDIKSLCQGRTVIFVLRAGAVEELYFADTVSVLSDGRVIESGTHHSLMERPGGRYAQIVRANMDCDVVIDDEGEDEEETGEEEEEEGGGEGGAGETERENTEGAEEDRRSDARNENGGGGGGGGARVSSGSQGAGDGATALTVVDEGARDARGA